MSLSVGGIAATGSGLTYTPGETIALIVSFEDTTKFRVGFQLTARAGDGCAQPGTLAAASSSSGTAIKTGTGTCGPASSEVQWATHQNPRNGSSATFAIDWAAPKESVGPVTIAVAVNGANGARDVRNDSIYTLQTVLQPSAAAPAAPVISDGGVTSLGDPDAQRPTAAPGGIAVVSGTGFADTALQRTGSVDTAGRLAKSAGGVCVEVNQVRAPVLSVDATSAFVQIPPETAVGPAAVQVIRNCDPAPEGPAEARSNVATVQIATVQPVLLQVAAAVPGAAAVHSDLAPVAKRQPSKSDKGAPAETKPVDEAGPAPAVPGEVVTFFGTGFGPTVPALASGEVPELASVLATSSVRLLVGQTAVPDDHIVYAGAMPGVVGMYQFSARIPDSMAAGDFPATLLVGGKASPAGPRLVIGTPAAPAEDERQACKQDMVLEVGDSCGGTLSGIPGLFTVEETQACIAAPTLNLLICDPASVNPLGLGILVVEKQGDDTWRVIKAP